VAAGRRSDGQGPFWGDLVGPNPTDRGKNGVKRSLLVEADGGPLSVVVAGANVRDDKLLGATLDAVVLERPEATEEAPQHLCLDKGYDNRPTRELVQERGYVAHVRRIGEEKLDEAGEKRYPASGGWWSARWRGCRSAGRSWCATRRRPPTTWA
jgi:hypothetical protein